MVAEDNEAVLKSLARGRCPKLRHVARTHRVNLDWCYDLFRHPEIEATYVQTLYQIVGLGTKAITKGEPWDRLPALLGIKAPGVQAERAQADGAKDKAGLETSSKSAPGRAWTAVWAWEWMDNGGTSAEWARSKRKHT